MTAALELWVGPEATVNRVADRYVDQLHRTGFASRPGDIERLASLKPARVRFPVLWERTERATGELDFRWSDECLARLRDHGIRPIIGLLHHGSGPPHTSLIDPQLPSKLARYAHAVARRYPWVDAWTPVNEPLTTARFAGLYGLWHPHGRDDRSFVRALLQQVHATVAGMRAVREVNPDAALIQTEDLGHTSGTAPLREQVDFDNTRRWLAIDLLLGRVNERHPMWLYLVEHGASESELDALVTAPLGIDLLGLNVYVTSERFLDHRTERYEAQCVGGNGRVAYADIEAVRCADARFGGFEARLAEAAARYPVPLAVTEAHLACTREEQMRWLLEAWRAAVGLRQRGVDVRAVTAWSAFGAYDWSTLLTQTHDRYESGLWDTRAPTPRATALSALARELSSNVAPSHPVLTSPGWWRRDVRAAGTPAPADAAWSIGESPGRPILITGGRGTLAQAFARLCELRGLPHCLLARHELDITRPASIAAALDRCEPWAVVNAAGYVRVDDAERDPRQWNENTLGPALLARACRTRDIPLLAFSSDLVFDGAKGRPYVEHDGVNPLCEYGRAKARAERLLLAMPKVLMVRSAAFFGPWDRHNFLSTGLQRLAQGAPWRAPVDQVVSPTYVPDLVNACLDLLIDGETGLWHVANRGALTWHDLACRAAEASRLPTRLVQAAPRAAGAAARPPYSALGTAQGQLIGDLDTALLRYLEAAPLQAPPSPSPQVHQASAP